MRSPTLLYLLTATFAVTAQRKTKTNPKQSTRSRHAPPSSEPSTSTPTDGDAVLVSDVIGKDRSINIFAGFTRDFANISGRFEDSNQNTTILAPVNSAIMGLPRKPWEDPDDYDKLGAEAYEGAQGEDRARTNLQRFVQAHVVPVSPWKEGEKVKTLAGGDIWWESKNGAKMIQPGSIEVSSIASRVHNGEVWILKGVRNYA